jgi:hypothetical protein
MSVPGRRALHRILAAPRMACAAGAAAAALGLVLATGTSTALASANGSLSSDDGTLHTGVGTYGDCSGHTPLQSGEAAVDVCIPGRTYFVGHNVGVFTPLVHMRVGDRITWTAASGARHRLRIVGVRDWVAANGTAPMVAGDVVAQFQTCLRRDGSLDRILDAVEDGALR